MGKEKEKIIVYHGTTDVSAQSIYDSKEFHLSSKKREWLGNGIYFWESESDAIWWAGLESNKEQNKGTHPAVLCVTLDFSSDQYVDLDRTQQRDWFRSETRSFASSLSKAPNGAPKKSITEHTFRCALCNYFKERNGIALMAATFPVYNERTNTATIAYDEYGFPVVPVRRQYCATDNSIISDIKIKEGEDYAV